MRPTDYQYARSKHRVLKLIQIRNETPSNHDFCLLTFDIYFPLRSRVNMSTHSYKANCHCGQVKLTFTLPEPIQDSEVIRCNCSICTKSGYINVYPLRKDVTFTSGEQTMTEYRFGNKDKPHKFCPQCGTSMLIDFRDSPYESEKPHYAINVSSCEPRRVSFPDTRIQINTIAGIQDLMSSLKIIPFDGHNRLKPSYEVPQQKNGNSC